MRLSPEQIFALEDPEASGVAQLAGFIADPLLSAVQEEISDPDLVSWRDNHTTFVNQRGLTIVQNHDVYALKLSRGDQTPLEKIPNIQAASEKVQRFAIGLAEVFTSMVEWEADELSLHRYDDPDLGLSLHKDNLRFTGLIAILSLEGEADLATDEKVYSAKPGDLLLLRAPGLLNVPGDHRPEHSVVNLRTPTRTSMMLRANKRPNEQIKGFSYDNWPKDQ